MEQLKTTIHAETTSIFFLSFIVCCFKWLQMTSKMINKIWKRLKSVIWETIYIFCSFYDNYMTSRISKIQVEEKQTGNDRSHFHYLCLKYHMLESSRFWSGNSDLNSKNYYKFFGSFYPSHGFWTFWWWFSNYMSTKNIKRNKTKQGQLKW